MSRAAALPLIGVLLVGQTPSWRPLDVVGGSGQPLNSSACTWDGPATFRQSVSGQLEVDCANAASAVLHCDVGGYESRDLPAVDVCRTATIKLDAGRLAQIHADFFADFHIAWFRWQDTVALEIRAVRQAARVVAFALLAAPGTFVRISATGLSPVTVTAEELTAEPVWKLAYPGPGGELFARHQAGPVVPDAVEIVGPLAFTLPIGRGWFDRPGLNEGIYSMRRVYPGGVKTPPLTAAVAMAQSTDAWLPLENVGGAKILAKPAICEAGDRLEILDMRRGTAVNIVSQSSACEWRVGGLEPGRYSVKITPAGDMPIVVRPFDVHTQQWTDVIVEGPPVVVRGRVRLLGEPAAGLELTFSLLTGAAESATALIKANGHYAIGLEHDGPYETALKTPMNTRVDRTLLQPGVNEHNIDVKGGKIRIVFSPGTSRENVWLWMDTPAGTISTHAGNTSSPIDLTVYELGTFGIGGHATDGRDKDLPVDRYQKVQITEQAPRATVEFRFAAFNEDLSVLDSGGRPRMDWFIRPPFDSRSGRSGASTRFQPLKTQAYRLPPGTPLQITAGAAQTCFELTNAGRAQVSFPQPLDRVEFRFEKAGDDLSGLVYGVSGATCPVPLSSFPFTRQKTDSYESVRFTLPAGNLVLEREGRKYPIRVPGGPIAIK